MTGRAYHSCAYNPVRDEIYVIGGSNSDRLATMEIYDVQTDTWRVGLSLPEAVDQGSLVYFDEKLYHFGGFGKSSAAVLDDVFVLDLNANTPKWEYPENLKMQTRRKAHVSFLLDVGSGFTCK